MYIEITAKLVPNSCSLSLDVSNKSNANAVDKRGVISKLDNSPMNTLSLSTGLSAPNREPMPSLILLINEPPLIALMPSPNDFNAGPANAKFFISVKLNIIVASAIFSMAGATNAPINMNGSSGAISAIAAPTANTPPAADVSPPPSTSARLAIPVTN